jgi:hypothetical protein
MSILMVFNLLPFLLFFQLIITNKVTNRGRWRVHLRKGVAKSQSLKNKGKITIGLHNRGKITNLPFPFHINYLNELASTVT